MNLTVFRIDFILSFSRPVVRRTADNQSQADRQTAEAVESILADDWSYMQRTAQMWSTNTKTGQYRRMRQEWRNNVILGRSRIQGLGLFVKKDIEEVFITINKSDKLDNAQCVR